MAEIQRRTLYQPQNVSQGFNPVKAADVTPFLRENERRRQGNQQQIDRAAARDLKTRQANLDLEAIEADRDLNALMAFAPTAEKLLQDWGKQQIAQKKADAVQWSASQQEERAKIVAQQNYLLQQLRADSISDEEYKLELAKLGVLPHQIDEANKFSSWDKYWRVYETVKNINEDQYDKSIREQFSSDAELINGKSWNSQDLDPDEYRYGLRLAENNFLAANNLDRDTTLGLELSVGQPIRDKINTDYADTFQKNYYINESQKQAALKRSQAFELRDPASISAWLNAEAQKLKSDGKSWSGFSAAHDSFFKELEKLSKTPAGALKANELLKAYGQVELNGKPFSTLQGARMEDFKSKYVANLKSGSGAVRDMMIEQATEESKELIDAVVNEPDFNRASGLALKKAIKQIYDTAGVPAAFDPKALGLDDVFSNLSVTGRDLQDLETEVKYRITHKTFNRDYFETLPAELQEKYANKLTEVDYLDSEDGNAITNALDGFVFQNHRVKGSKAADRAAFGDVLKVDAQREVESKARQDQDSASPKFNSFGEAYNHFMKEKIDEMRKGIADPESIYYHGNDGYMNYIENKIGKMEDVTAARRHKIRTFYGTYKTIGQGVWSSPNSVASDAGLVDLKNRIEQGDIPQYVKDMNRVTGGNLIKNVNKQLAESGIDPIEMFTELPPMPPRVEQIINKTLDGSINQLQAVRETFAFRSIRPKLQDAGMPSLVAQNLGGDDPSGFNWNTISNTREKGEYLLNYMTKDLGMSDVHAMGLLANAMRESTLRTNIVGADGTPVGDHGQSNFMFQWHAGRLDSAIKAMGESRFDPRAQIRYALEEPGEPGQEYLRMQFSSAQEAADWWADRWERPYVHTKQSEDHLNYWNKHRGIISRWNQGGV
tara:strand:+ start:790 stop:3459 length:2670 start_codon:yes stop_codon:yes gene_type:complete